MSSQELNGSGGAAEDEKAAAKPKKKSMASWGRQVSTQALAVLLLRGCLCIVIPPGPLPRLA